MKIIIIWELLGEEFIEKRLSIIDPIVAVEKRMLEKIQARVSFEPLTSVIPVQCSAHWTNKPTESKSPQKVIFLRSYTVEPQYNDPWYNDIPGITIDMLCPGKSYSKMYGTEPRYNDLRYNDIPDITMSF